MRKSSQIIMLTTYILSLSSLLGPHTRPLQVVEIAEQDCTSFCVDSD